MLNCQPKSSISCMNSDRRLAGESPILHSQKRPKFSSAQLHHSWEPFREKKVASIFIVLLQDPTLNSYRPSILKLAEAPALNLLAISAIKIPISCSCEYCEPHLPGRYRPLCRYMSPHLRIPVSCCHHISRIIDRKVRFCLR
jgi:hypothetical protein